jgi:hypothetical protein
MDHLTSSTLVGLGIVVILSRSSLAFPVRYLVLWVIDRLVLWVGSWKSTRLKDQLISLYVAQRTRSFCMMCCSFWVGLALHYWLPVTKYALADGLYLSAIGWLATRLEEISIGLTGD